MISNQPPAELYLDPRSRSRINVETLPFTPYAKEELIEILEKRMDQAFYPGTISSDVLEVIAEHVAETSGDCREALKPLSVSTALPIVCSGTTL